MRLLIFPPVSPRKELLADRGELERTIDLLKVRRIAPHAQDCPSSALLGARARAVAVPAGLTHACPDAGEGVKLQRAVVIGWTPVV